ncbi:MAG: hypothetical protein ACSLE0_12185 [Chitinophagaceae bacterium]
MKFKTFKKYFFNCFLLTIPVLLWDYFFTDRLPEAFQPEIFWKDIPSFITYGENISRILMFVFISFMPLNIIPASKRTGYYCMLQAAYYILPHGLF